MEKLEGITPDLENASTPIEGVMISGQPDEGHLTRLAAAGFKTVLDLRAPDEPRGFDEPKVARQAGLEYRNVPVDAGAPSDTAFGRVRRMLSDAGRHHILVHCGTANRAAGLLLPYLILDQNREPSEALEIALRAGLNSADLERAALDYSERHVAQHTEQKAPHKKPQEDAPLKRKFDPANASQLDRSERQEFLPNEKVLDLLELEGTETVVEYGSGSGVLTIPLSRSLRDGGTVQAVEENQEMVGRLQERLSMDIGEEPANVKIHHVRDNSVPLPDGIAERVLAVNLLHEVVGETALEEMLRLLAPAGFLLVVDWRADAGRDFGPPPSVALPPESGRKMLEEAGFIVNAPTDTPFPYHFVFVARKANPHDRRPN